MNTNKFDYFEVPADIGVRVWGNSINVIFMNAALAVTNLMINPKYIEKKILKEIEIIGNDLSSLLVNWITEILVIRDSEKILFSSFEIEVSRDQKSLKAKAWGNYIEGIPLEMDIKAITYSMFKFEEINENNFYVQFVLDI